MKMKFVLLSTLMSGFLTLIIQPTPYLNTVYRPFLPEYDEFYPSIPLQYVVKQPTQFQQTPQPIYERKLTELPPKIEEQKKEENNIDTPIEEIKKEETQPTIKEINKPENEETRNLSLVQVEDPAQEERKDISLLDSRKRALLWIFSSFLQILKKNQVHSIEEIRQNFKSFFTADEEFFEGNFLSVFQSNFKQKTHSLNFQRLEDDLAMKVMNFNIPENINFIQNVVMKNDEQKKKETSEGVSQEYLNNLNTLQNLLQLKEKIMTNPSQEEFIILSLNDPTIVNIDQFNAKILQAQSFIQGYIKYFKGLKYSQKLNGDIKIKEGQQLLKIIEDGSYGLFFLRYIDAFEEMDSQILNIIQKQELFEKISQIRNDLNSDEYYRSVFKALQKFPQLGERTFGDKNELISKAVFFQFFDNLVRIPKFKYLIEYYFVDFFQKFDKLLTVYFGNDFQDMIMFDYEKYLTFMSKQLTFEKFLNLNKLFQSIYDNTISLSSKQEQSQSVDNFLKLNLNILLQVYYPYMMIKDSNKYNNHTKNYQIPEKLNLRNQNTYKQNDQNIIQEKSSFINDSQRSNEIIQFVEDYLNNLKTPQQIEEFKQSPNYSKIYKILEQYFGKDFLNTSEPNVFKQNDNNLMINKNSNVHYKVDYQTIGPEIRIANFILHLFKGFNEDIIEKSLNQIKEFNDSNEIDYLKDLEIEKSLLKSEKLQIKFLAIFTTKQYQVIRKFLKILISNYSSKCYLNLFGKLTKNISQLKQNGKMQLASQLDLLLANLFTFLKNKSTYSFDNNCEESNHKFETQIISKTPIQPDLPFSSSEKKIKNKKVSTSSFNIRKKKSISTSDLKIKKKKKKSISTSDLKKKKKKSISTSDLKKKKKSTSSFSKNKKKQKKKQNKSFSEQKKKNNKKKEDTSTSFAKESQRKKIKQDISDELLLDGSESKDKKNQHVPLKKKSSEQKKKLIEKKKEDSSFSLGKESQRQQNNIPIGINQNNGHSNSIEKKNHFKIIDQKNNLGDDHENDNLFGNESQRNQDKKNINDNLILHIDNDGDGDDDQKNDQEKIEQKIIGDFKEDIKQHQQNTIDQNINDKNNNTELDTKNQEQITIKNDSNHHQNKDETIIDLSTNINNQNNQGDQKITHQDNTNHHSEINKEKEHKNEEINTHHSSKITHKNKTESIEKNTQQIHHKKQSDSESNKKSKKSIEEKRSEETHHQTHEIHHQTHDTHQKEIKEKISEDIHHKQNTNIFNVLNSQEFKNTEQSLKKYINSSDKKIHKKSISKGKKEKTKKTSVSVNTSEDSISSEEVKTKKRGFPKQFPPEQGFKNMYSDKFYQMMKSDKYLNDDISFKKFDSNNIIESHRNKKTTHIDEDISLGGDSQNSKSKTKEKNKTKTGDKHKTVSGTKKRKTESTHKKHKTESTHKKHKTESTHKKHKTESTHKKHKTESTHKKHKTESTHKKHKTESTHKKHKTESTHKKHKTESTHKKHKTESTHKKHKTESTHKKHKTESTHKKHKTISGDQHHKKHKTMSDHSDNKKQNKKKITKISNEEINKKDKIENTDINQHTTIQNDQKENDETIKIITEQNETNKKNTTNINQNSGEDLDEIEIKKKNRIHNDDIEIKNHLMTNNNEKNKHDTQENNTHIKDINSSIKTQQKIEELKHEHSSFKSKETVEQTHIKKISKKRKTESSQSEDIPFKEKQSLRKSSKYGFKSSQYNANNFTNKDNLKKTRYSIINLIKTPPPQMHKFKISERNFLKQIDSSLYKTYQLKEKQRGSGKGGENILFKTIIFKQKKMTPSQTKFIQKMMKKFEKTNSIQTFIKESNPMKQKLQKIIYKTVKKRICQRLKPKKDCEKECYRMIDGIKHKITKDDPEYVDLCEEKYSEKEDEEKIKDEYEQYECDLYGNDISLLGSPGKKQINKNPIFNINFVVEDEKSLDKLQNFIESKRFANILSPLSQDNVMNIEELSKNLKFNGLQKVFNVNVSPREQETNEGEMELFNGQEEEQSKLLF